MANAPRRNSRYFTSGSLAEARSVLSRRPTVYDPEISELIISMVSCGESLNEICQDPEAPLPATFLQWCKEDAKLGERYRDALEMQADLLFEEATSAAHGPDAVLAGVRYRSLITRAERMIPDKYGPRATIRNTKEVDDEAGGIDYAGEVRRRLEAMSSRLRTDQERTSDA